MEKEIKYILNWGLAFSEKGTMIKLSNLAKKGWILDSLTTFRYKLVKGKPKDIIYTVDCNASAKNDEEYFDMFRASGWQHACSYGPFHFFYAKPGTVPIYTDSQTYKESYLKYKSIYIKSLLISAAVLVCTVMLDFSYLGKFAKGFLDVFITIIAGISAAIFLVSLMLVVAFNLKGRKHKFTN